MAQAKVLSDSDKNKLFKHLRTTLYPQRNRCIVQLTHYAALRIGEVAQLKIRDVLNADNTVKDELRFKSEQVKEKRDGNVPICPKLQQELRNYLDTIDTTNLDKPLFASQRQDHFSANSLTQIVNSFYRDAGISGATSHSGRRTVITTLANKGVNVRLIQAIARHSSITVTQRYIDVNDELKRNAVGLL